MSESVFDEVSRLRDALLAQPDHAPSDAADSIQLRPVQDNHGFPEVSLDDYPDFAHIRLPLPDRYWDFCQALPLLLDGRTAVIGMVDPHDERRRALLQTALDPFEMHLAQISRQSWAAGREIAKSASATVVTKPSDLRLTYTSASGASGELINSDRADLLGRALYVAVSAGASDLHFEPRGDQSRVRIRIDGQLAQGLTQVAMQQFEQMIGRLKVMCDLDVTQARLPQDGSFVLKVNGRAVDTRVSITPCIGGEKGVVRILDSQRVPLSLDQLAVWPTARNLLDLLFRQPSGLILVTGPTGAGKSTTLYGGLNRIWSASQTLNIVTIEDPVEYHLDCATQIQINRAAGLTFARILRSVLRQDPDVILVGEIRDQETAEIALEAAVTGHLVLSTLHTFEAPEAITRLRSLDVEPFLIGQALKGVVSQKLVRAICPHCAEPLSRQDQALVHAKQLNILDEVCQAFRGRGCAKCRDTGELGRVSCYEILAPDSSLRALLESGASDESIRRALTPQNFLSFRSSARALVDAGFVTPENAIALFPSVGV